MKRTKQPLPELAEVTKYLAAMERASFELAKFIEFVEYHNPNINRTAAVLTSAICLKQLPDLFIDNPDLIQRLKAIASELQS